MFRNQGILNLSQPETHVEVLGISWRIVALIIFKKTRPEGRVVVAMTILEEGLLLIPNRYYSTTFIFTASKFLLYTLLVFISKYIAAAPPSFFRYSQVSTPCFSFRWIFW